MSASDPLEYTHKARLLDAFFALDLHPRLLLYLRGETETEEWKTLERLVLDPNVDPATIFHGGVWRRWWNATPPHSRVPTPLE